MKNVDLDKKISNWLKKYLKINKLNCFVVGISGGIDSAVVSTLCAQTNQKTIVVSMPIHQAEDQLKRAEKHIDFLKNKYKNVISTTLDLTSLFDNFKSLFDKDPICELSLANSRSRLRMVSLYQIAGIKKGLVVGTGNKIEDFGIGFFTKYGDGGVDISPIGDLTKSQVRELAKKMNINTDILVAKPTDGLWDDNRTDEDQIGLSYEELEWAMENIDNKNEKMSKKQKKAIKIFKKLNFKNQHKINPIPIFKINEH